MNLGEAVLLARQGALAVFAEDSSSFEALMAARAALFDGEEQGVGEVDCVPVPVQARVCLEGFADGLVGGPGWEGFVRIARGAVRDNPRGL